MGGGGGGGIPKNDMEVKVKPSSLLRILRAYCAQSHTLRIYEVTINIYHCSKIIVASK